MSFFIKIRLVCLFNHSYSRSNQSDSSVATKTDAQISLIQNEIIVKYFTKWKTLYITQVKHEINIQGAVSKISSNFIQI